uniref:C2 calcium dependent domain containing 5 n=1 Tax=Scleropages formosus TaxID=113540 RepID=A0A8D0CJA7_SCLFO
MPGKLKAKILAGRHLPVMDRASDLTDAFVEVKFGNTTFKTDVFPKSLNPQWNSEWFKFEVDDEDLQDEPLQITVLDHDTYSANDAIGKVYIDIDPLLSTEAATVISGWFPIYDTIHGIRGEISVLVKVELFSDSNRFRQSSCGVKFFSVFCNTRDALHLSCPAPSIPRCYRLAAVHGFVEELVVNEDPEHQWIDRIRTPRASNEARQRLISLMSGELQRKIGLKVLEMGGNAVVGYLQCFDLEGESGLVVRAIGTACTLEKPGSLPPSAPSASPSMETKEPSYPVTVPSPGPSAPLKYQPFSSSSPKSCRHQSSCSDTDLSFVPKIGIGSSGSSGKEGCSFKMPQKQVTPSALEQREFPFFTFTRFPPGFLLHVGGVVSARSVKLLDRIYNPDEPETRDAWWEEIRQEIKSHAKALGCHAVVGYSESTSICDEVCILSAAGTAAVLDPTLMQEGCLDDGGEHSCVFCHVPYDDFNSPFPAHLAQCCTCGRHKVPDVLFTTIELPREAKVSGKGCLIQARLCRLKKKAQGEASATAVSNLLPFMEYELHTQLMNKLKLRAMNALFGLRVQISLGENMVVGLASATGVYLNALPSPGGVQIAGKTPGDTAQEQHISNMQRKINDTIAGNKELYEINPLEVAEDVSGSPIPEPQRRPRLFRSVSESSTEVPELDLAYGRKDAFVLEIDDTDALEDMHSLLTDAPAPSGFYSCNTEVMPGIYSWTSAVQMFTSVRMFRLGNANLTNQGVNKAFNDLCEDLLKSLYFKVRSMVPCCLCHLNFSVAVPEEELVQVTVTAAAMTFDKDAALTTTLPAAQIGMFVYFLSLKVFTWFQPLSPALSVFPASSVDYGSFADRCSTLVELIKVKAQTMRRGSIKTSRGVFRHTRSNAVTVVKMTPLSFIPNTRIIKYLGIINMFFIRETSSLREEGGVSGFLHGFITEVFAMVRAHVAALGGNAVLSYQMKECVFMENPNKNQAQCLINVSGDAFLVYVRFECTHTHWPVRVSTGAVKYHCQDHCAQRVSRLH